MKNDDLFYASRPVELPHIGDFYYPEGIPNGTSDCVTKSKYIDMDGKLFWICYTSKQMDHHIDRNMGIYCPYIPLMMGKPL